MLDSLTTTWSRPLKIVRVLQALGMDVPMRLRRERLALMMTALSRAGIEVVLADGSAVDPGDSPGIEGKVRLRRGTNRVAPPRQIFNYTVISQIPTGGMSECFKVRAPDGTLRFLKRVSVEGIEAAALRREADIYAKLERASALHVLAVHEWNSSGSTLALVTELADGGTLEEHIETQGPLTPGMAKAIALAVLDGIEELHGLDIVHRDLKPLNVLRCGDRWKLADFGISKNLARRITQGKTFQGMGTKLYSAPEQWDIREAHPTADVFAFGKILAFLLTGEPSVDALEEQPRWAELARQCTAHDPDARPSVAEIREAMERL